MNKQEMIIELLNIIDSAELKDNIMQKMIDAFESIIEKLNIDTEKFIDLMRIYFKDQYFEDKFLQQKIEIYDSLFSEQEITDFINFYKSESGSKYIKTQSILIDKLILLEDLKMREIMGVVVKNMMPADVNPLDLN